jgi:hypothetical protein
MVEKKPQAHGKGALSRFVGFFDSRRMWRSGKLTVFPAKSGTHASAAPRFSSGFNGLPRDRWFVRLPGWNGQRIGCKAANLPLQPGLAQ